MRRVLLPVLLALIAGSAVPSNPRVAAQTAIPVQIEQVVLSSVSEWESGLRGGLLITNNAGGELRLDDQISPSETAVQQTGVFSSSLEQVDLAFNAVGAVWRAQVPPGTTLELEVRGGPQADQLGDWRPLRSGDARSQSDDGALALEAVQPIDPGARFLQFRARFSSTLANASPVLSNITLYALESTAGPALSAGLPRVPVLYGPATLTPQPRIIQRADWAGGAPDLRIARQQPRGILIHQIGSDALSENPLPFLRALTAYSSQVLGWDDLPFHFIVDGGGNIYEGHVGGPTSDIPRLDGGDQAIHIALIGSDTPTPAAREALTGLLAWLGQAYQITPTGQHTVVQLDGGRSARPNIAAHDEVVAEAVDPGPALRGLLPALRQEANQATVRARWYFAEGNPHDYAERLAVLNPTGEEAAVRFRLLPAQGQEIVRTTSVAPGGRIDLVVNTIVSDTTDLPAIIESSAPVIAERFMDFGQDIAAGPGVDAPSRVWYFAEGSTEGDARTFLVLFNPQTAAVNATVTFMRDDGSTTQQQTSIPAGQRTVVAVADGLPDAAFGARVVATQPIVAERTMIFGAGSSLTQGGFHSTPGVVTLSRRWYFAEGTTQAPFQMRVLVLNPNAQPSNVAVTFQTPDGTSLTRRYAIPATSRLAINVNEVVPDLGVATTVAADRPVAVERALYWKEGAAGTASAGATAPAYTWRFADGRTSGSFQEYLLFNNPNRNQARVSVEFVLADGTRASQAIVMPGGARYTMAVHQLYPDQQAIAATVYSTQPVVAERSLYPGAPQSADNRGGATAFGVPQEEP